MEKKQADAIARAILEPELRAQEEMRQKQLIGVAKLARQRRVAWFSLAGAAVGAAVAYFGGMRFSFGVIFGGLAGSAIGRVITRRAA